MKKILLTLILLLPVLFLFNACEDKSDLTSPDPIGPVNGNANFTRYVAIGNSITAGFQSNALYQEAQEFSFPNLIAKQTNTASFEQPLVSSPGIGSKMEIISLSPFTISSSTTMGTTLNLNLGQPYNNLGIPGAVLYDVLNARSAATSASKSAIFDVILRGIGTQFEQARMLQPTFITLWIGNNDVLGFATSGGVRPTSPTTSAVFQALYAQLADSIASLNAKVAVANIPDVSAIPFFTTVGRQMAASVPWSALPTPGLAYQKHGETVATSWITASSLSSLSILIPLTASSYAGLVGQPTGKWYRDNKYPALPVGIDTTQAFGVHPQNPIPDALVLDADEIQTAKSATIDFNNTIAAVAQAKGWALVDIYTVFNNIRLADAAGGMSFDGVVLSTTYVTGGLFSLDGVHPANYGHGVIANEFLKAINAKFGSSFPLVAMGSLPGSIEFAKRSGKPLGLPDFIGNGWKNFIL